MRKRAPPYGLGRSSSCHKPIVAQVGTMIGEEPRVARVRFRCGRRMERRSEDGDGGMMVIGKGHDTIGRGID